MESNNRNDMPAFMDTDLDPYTLVHDIVSNWWVIILGAIAGALLTYVVVSSRYVPELYNAGDIRSVIQRGCECIQ